MTPGARIQTAAELLDQIFAGQPTEKVLTGWARRSRYAGSGDRYAVRDLVFSALRNRRSFGWLGNGENGRAVMLGYCRAENLDPDEIFAGTGYAPASLSDAEREFPAPLEDAPMAVHCDVPDWVLPFLHVSLGSDAREILARMRDRAPVFLRANRLKCTRDEALVRLTDEDFDVGPFSLADMAIIVEGSARKLANSGAVRDGFVEFQDASSQAVVDRLEPFLPNSEILDYCAGGGGKALAMSGYHPARIVAHDQALVRMRNIEPRAARAGARITTATDPEGKFDLVVCDVPCSGSGAWRRQPEAKWRLTRQTLEEFTATQSKILLAAKGFVRPSGYLAYITCSLFKHENDDRIDKFLSENRAWAMIDKFRLTPLDGGDGFFLAVLKAPEANR